MKTNEGGQDITLGSLDFKEKSKAVVAGLDIGNFDRDDS